jgi:hypothetical protein
VDETAAPVASSLTCAHAGLEPFAGGGSYVFTDAAAFSVNTPILVAGAGAPISCLSADCMHAHTSQ